MSGFDTFFKSYIETALWASSDINSEEDTSLLMKNYTIDDFDEKSLDSLHKDCVSFFSNNFELIKDNPSLAGHDFFLTQNRHGAGFWDGDWPKEIGDKLTKESHNYGETNFWVSEGKIYCE
jgi:hypothetical protein